MRLRLSFFVSILICLFSLFAFFFVKSTPASKLWTGYRVLFSSNDSHLTEKILFSNGCYGFISKSNESNKIFEKYFFDLSGNFELFYIPDEQSNVLDKVISDLQDIGYSAGVDGVSETSFNLENTFSVKIPAVCCLFFLFLLTFSRRKIHYFFGGLFFVILTFARPNVSICVACCVALLGVFILFKLWSFSIFAEINDFAGLKNKYHQKDKIDKFNLLSIIFLMLSPFFILIFTNVLNAVVYLLAVISSFSILVFVDSLSHFFEIILRKPFRRFLSCISLSIVFLLGYQYAIETNYVENVDSKISENNIKSSSVEIEVPVPVISKDSEKNSLPCLDDLVVYEWNKKTLPYRRINQNTVQVANNFEDVKISEYTEIDGKIVSEEKLLYTFDDSFRNSVIDAIKNSEKKSSIANVLLLQSDKTNCDYEKLSGYDSSMSCDSESFDIKFSIAYLLILLVFTGYHLFAILKKIRK